MIPGQYPNYYKALEIYTGYFDSLDIMILFLFQQYCNNKRLLYIILNIFVICCTLNVSSCLTFLFRAPIRSSPPYTSSPGMAFVNSSLPPAWSQWWWVVNTVVNLKPSSFTAASTWTLKRYFRLKFELELWCRMEFLFLVHHNLGISRNSRKHECFTLAVISQLYLITRSNAQIPTNKRIILCLGKQRPGAGLVLHAHQLRRMYLNHRCYRK